MYRPDLQGQAKDYSMCKKGEICGQTKIWKHWICFRIKYLNMTLYVICMIFMFLAGDVNSPALRMFLPSLLW